MAATEAQQSWQETIAEWQDSGLSGAAFCKQHSLVYHRFVYWRRKLSVRPEQESVARSGSGFARVVSLPTPSLEGITVSLPGGVSITGLHAGNVALLGTILKQL